VPGAFSLTLARLERRQGVRFLGRPQAGCVARFGREMHLPPRTQSAEKIRRIKVFPPALVFLSVTSAFSAAKRFFFL
jgi:hypothetical protein